MRLTDCNIGLAAYQKKPEFGPASIKADDVEFNNIKNKIIVQLGSEVSLNGASCEAQELDVDKLYQKDYVGLGLK